MRGEGASCPTSGEPFMPRYDAGRCASRHSGRSIISSGGNSSGTSADMRHLDRLFQSDSQKFTIPASLQHRHSARLIPVSPDAPTRCRRAHGHVGRTSLTDCTRLASRMQGVNWGEQDGVNSLLEGCLWVRAAATAAQEAPAQIEAAARTTGTMARQRMAELMMEQAGEAQYVVRSGSVEAREA